MKLFDKPGLRQLIVVMAGALLAVTSTGYTSTDSQGARTSVSTANQEPEPELRVVLLPGDVVDIKFFYNPELNESQTVRPDGKITLQLIGDIKVEEKTTDELREDLIELFTPHLKIPEIAVIARSLLGRRVYVGGEVIAPGVVTMQSRLTALEAIMQAGGFDLPSARVGNVVIVRHKNGQRYGCKLNLKNALKGKEAEPFYLEPYDIVYVPQTRITKATQWIDQHINMVIPDFGFTYSRPIGTGTIGIYPRAVPGRIR